jgi:hypothetical protein
VTRQRRGKGVMIENLGMTAAEGAAKPGGRGGASVVGKSGGQPAAGLLSDDGKALSEQ